MKKKKYNRPFVEVLTLETTRGMMGTTSPDKGKPGNPPVINSMKRPGTNSSKWEDDLDEAVDDCDTSDFGYCN